MVRWISPLSASAITSWARPRGFVKNVRGAIQVAGADVEIDILGGDRINFKRGFRWTLTRKAHFHGMVGGEEKTACCGLLGA